MKFLSKLNRLKQYTVFSITLASFKIFWEGDDISVYTTMSMVFPPYIFISKKLKLKNEVK